MTTDYRARAVLAAGLLLAGLVAAGCEGTQAPPPPGKADKVDAGAYVVSVPGMH